MGSSSALAMAGRGGDRADSDAARGLSLLEGGLADGRGFAECLSRLELAVSDLAEADVSAVGAENLVPGSKTLARLISRLGAVRAQMLLGIEKNESWRSSGARTFAQWNEKASGQSPTTAIKEIKRAEALGGDLARMSEAFKGGAVFAEHVDVVRRVFSAPSLKEKLSDAVQDEFVAWARECAPREFGRRVKARAFQEDPAFGVETEKAEAKKENIAFAKDGSGMRVTGWLSDESSALVDTAFGALMGRKRADDARTLPQRRAEALVQLAGAKLDEGSLGKGAKIRPHLSVHVPVETLVGVEKAMRGSTAGCPAIAGEGCPGSQLNLRRAHSPESRERGRRSSSAPEKASTPDGPAHREESCHSLKGQNGGGQGRFGQCLNAVRRQENELGRVLGLIPALTDVDALSGLEPAALDDGSPLSATQLARLLCDSAVSRAVLSASGEVLNVGREKRLFTAAQTRAVIARDRTCRYPGCPDTIAHGQIHHALPWEAGGETDLANAVLLCWHHHALVHREGIAITHHDGGFVFTSVEGEAIGVRRHGT